MGNQLLNLDVAWKSLLRFRSGIAGPVGLSKHYLHPGGFEVGCFMYSKASVAHFRIVGFSVFSWGT
jgi:hypothetical protein